jgi:hypothetical protein
LPDSTECRHVFVGAGPRACPFGGFAGHYWAPTRFLMQFYRAHL